MEQATDVLARVLPGPPNNDNNSVAKLIQEQEDRAHLLNPLTVGEDSVEVGMDDVYKSLTILGDEIISKLNEILKEELPDGIESLDPKDHTPEKTAERIVTGSVAMFEAYMAQNPDRADEEKLDSYMAAVRSGVQKGYEDAVGILEALGALDIPGVAEGIEETMRLVEEKLSAFEDRMRKQITGEDGEGEAKDAKGEAEVSESDEAPKADSQPRILQAIAA